MRHSTPCATLGHASSAALSLMWEATRAVLVPETPVPLEVSVTWTQVVIYAVVAWTARAVYKDVLRSVQTFPTHLRFRRPTDGGEGRESTTGLVECVKPKRHANRSDARVAREQCAIIKGRAVVRMALPTPAENARRYAAEGGTW